MSAVQIVEQLLQQAFSVRASDIHLEAAPAALRVRFRIDGLLADHQSISLEISSQVVARIKVLARLDVAEKRVPQDGKFTVAVLKGSMDLRVATFPGLYGEKVVIRILDRSASTRTLNELGMSEKLYKHLAMIVRRPTGFFLTTGPTGSGKTTTLYAILSLIQSAEKNVITLEDPIEYSIDGITQGQVLPEVGFTFARGMRALLRGDPDIIMVGEIRDKETADVAIQAALTGHFVLSTSHTNDAPGALMRLIDMGIPPFLINATLSGVLAQRLVRVLCVECRYECDPTHDEREFLHTSGVTVARCYKAPGCLHCNGRGYKGRTGIFELLVMTQPIRELIAVQPSYDKIVAQGIQGGMIPLRIDAGYKIDQGITSISELARAIWY
jgi:type II secretory ATPase GspE/PulE/Tfp pilus assembly ATPase PilB-like protein